MGIFVGEGCNGKDCPHYRKYYQVQKSGEREVFLPVFDLVDEYCAHPSIYKPSDKISPLFRTGVKLSSIKHCPLC